MKEAECAGGRLTDKGGSMTAHLVVVSGEDRSRDLESRRQELGIEITDLAREAGMTREQVGKILAGKVPNSRSMRKLELAMDRLEAEVGRGPLVRNGNGNGNGGPSLVKFTIHGVYGAAEVIVEGPVANMAELQAAVDRLLRGERGKESAE